MHGATGVDDGNNGATWMCVSYSGENSGENGITGLGRSVSDPGEYLSVEEVMASMTQSVSGT